MLTADLPFDPPDLTLPTVLVVPDRLWRAMADHAQTARPNESVGLLATVRDGSGIVATAWFPGTNVDASPMRYTMDRTEVGVAVARMARSSWSLGVIVHSHPDDPAVPSETDLREHRYPDALMGIISLAAEQPKLRVWAPGRGHARTEQRTAEIAVRIMARRTIDEEHW